MPDKALQDRPELRAPMPWQQSQWQRLWQRFERGQMAHAHLLSGEQGLGKKAFARDFARLMLCQNPVGQQACGTCVTCRQGGAHYHPDIFLLEVEEGSKEIKIQQVRAVSEFALRSSHAGGAKIVLIYDAHRLNGNAANALLKTLEEPSSSTYLFLVSDLPGRLLPTIRSRCQKLAFPLPSREHANAWLHNFLSDSETDELLRASGNRPLRALELSGSDELQVQREFIDGLSKLASGNISLQSLLARSLKTGESRVLRYLSQTSSILIKYLLSDQLPQQSDQLSKDFCASINIEKGRLTSVVKQLLGFYQEVELARGQLSSSTNPNPQLIMESLLWRWSKLPLSIR